jgi:glucosamine kinase
MSNPTDIVIGIDGGASTTRVIVSDLRGNVLSHAQCGSSFAPKNPTATKNVQQTIRNALATANRRPQEVKSLVAGIAGYDRISDMIWVQPLTAAPGIICTRHHLNDAMVAHSGAFLGEPGIIVIGGSGCIILGITEAGRQIRNYDFLHYAPGGARFLGLNVMHEALAGNIDPSDENLIQKILAHWQAPTLEKIRERGAAGFMAHPIELDNTLRTLAPTITAAASGGSRLAQRVCDNAIEQIVVGVKMIAPLFAQQPPPTALIGSVANSDYFKKNLSRKLSEANCQPIEPRLSPTAGAVLMALKKLNVGIDDQVIENLRKNPQAR